jgi:hypothetical protein
MTVPKATVNEYGHLPRPENYVGFAWKLGGVESVSVARAMK